MKEKKVMLKYKVLNKPIKALLLYHETTHTFVFQNTP